VIIITIIIIHRGRRRDGGRGEVVEMDGLAVFIRLQVIDYIIYCVHNKLNQYSRLKIDKISTYLYT